jgi:hypothetical protein
MIVDINLPPDQDCGTHNPVDECISHCFSYTEQNIASKIRACTLYLYTNQRFDDKVKG